MNHFPDEDRALWVARERCAMENRAEAARLIRQSYPDAHHVVLVVSGSVTPKLTLAAIYDNDYRRIWDANYRNDRPIPLQVERVTARLGDAYRLAPAYFGSEPGRLPRLRLDQHIKLSSMAAAERLADHATDLRLHFRQVLSLAETLAINTGPIELLRGLTAAINERIGERNAWEQLSMMASERALHLAAVAYLEAHARPATLRPEPGEGRRWAWVTYDEEFAYPASVQADGPDRCRPLFPLDQVERLRRHCAALAETLAPGLVDTLVWIAPGRIAEMSGQWDINGDDLHDLAGLRRPEAVPAQVFHDVGPDGLYAIGIEWTWRVLRDDEVNPGTATVGR
jgi:hypothetical protein